MSTYEFVEEGDAVQPLTAPVPRDEQSVRMEGSGLMGRFADHLCLCCSWKPTSW